MRGRICCTVVCWGLLLGLAGCDEQAVPPATARFPDYVPEASRFDPTTAGSIRGQVLWQGDLPAVPPLLARANPAYGDPLKKDRSYDNPNAPAVDAAGRGVGSTVVFLRGVDPAQARPWDHAPVHVEQRDCLLHVLQGDTDSRVGFVRQNASVEMVSKDPWLHMLRCTGSACFTLAFPEADQPLTRAFTKQGVAELTGGAGYYWMRSYLFVDEHPYYARTDGRGRFALEQVPPGRYRLVCWAPNWLEERHERDPETGLVVRLYFRPPAQQEQAIVVPPSGAVRADFSLSAAAFQP